MIAPLAITLSGLPSMVPDECHELPNVAAIYVALAGEAGIHVGQSISLRQRWLAQRRLLQHLPQEMN